jgi:chromosome segregation protein
MRIKRLEVQGFKSFKDKTVIHFDHNITGIVGPNGCGKSNIVDAFFWVMGEQSYKHMRGTSSEDLIFNGSSKYTPSGVAEATLIMETDVPDTANAPSGATASDVPLHLRAKEIAVTRRVYRTGEGEYFINGVPARLKDIQELFMDTGVGAKGYSVIEQGQIGKIVNAKPEERRLLIEEAAGIAKYKKRKQESLRKLDATHANLSRLNDVIQEIERNLSSLERQAQKARQYRKYKDELLDKEMTWGRRKSVVLAQRLEQLKAEREAMEQELVGLRAGLSGAENAIEVDRIEQLSCTKAAEEVQARIQEMASRLAHQESALELSRKRQRDLSAQVETLTQERQELQMTLSVEEERLATQEMDVQASEASFGDTAARAQELDSQLRSLRASADAARREQESRKRELMASIAQASDRVSRSASLASRMESAQAQAERLRSQSAAQLEKVAAARAEAERAQDSVSELSARREQLQNERKSRATELQALEQELKRAERDRDELSRQATQARSRLSSLEELAAAHEGFGDGPKAVLDWARENGLSSQLGAVSDAFEVEPGYEAALEGWLEQRLEDLISADPAVALQGLERIQTEKSGRASIHVHAPEGPTSSFSNQTMAVIQGAGFEVLGALEQFVRVSSRKGVASNIASRLISRVAVVRDLGRLGEFVAAGGVSRLGDWSMVALDGSVLDSEGVLRGGSTRSSEAASVLGRKRAISELQVQVEALAAQLVDREHAVSTALESVEAARAALQQLQGSLQEVDVESAAQSRDLHQITRALKDAESGVELIELEAAEMARQAEEARSQRAEMEAGLVEIAARRSRLESAIAEGELAVSAGEDEVRAREAELSAVRVEEAQMRERAQSLRREVEAGRTLMNDRKRRLGEVERVLERASREREQHTGGDAGLEESISTLMQSLAEARARLSELKDRLEQAGSKLNQALDRIKELHALGDEKTARSNQLALEAEKLSGELAHLVQNLEEKYGPGCLERPVTSPIQEEMPEQVVTREMTAEEEQLLGEEVERLRERIRRLGEVNVMAIEEYEETHKRFESLVHEKQDLEQSIQDLQDAIEHINKTSEDRFKRAFDSIADRFERLFPIIFGGGEAKLSLVYPEGSQDILDAGVDILARPPGKKISNMSLLSGGEKALTAVSMIFAIFMVKPSPFCILDEVDAPLDDANIGKFNALLREMSSKSQFILITHNKKTMELNDTLYGVTMEEPGVSKMVSIEMQ